MRFLSFAVVSSILFLLSALGSERLEYEIRYGPVVLGSMVIEQLPRDSSSGERLDHLRATVEIDGSLALLFWAEYRLESWYRSEDMVTLRSYKKTVEKNYRDEWFADYDYAQGLIRYSDGRVFPLSDSTRDMLTLWFYLRNRDWCAGDSRVVNAHIDRRNWRLCFVATGTRRIKTAAGEFPCWVLRPKTSGPLGTVFLSRDRYRVPVLLRTRIAGFTVSAYLRRMTGR